jgi:hypothetical protein
MWHAYLEAVRTEVLLGLGVFSEDEHLRCLLEECFEHGDVSNGVVLWRDEPGLTGVDND